MTGICIPVEDLEILDRLRSDSKVSRGVMIDTLVFGLSSVV